MKTRNFNEDNGMWKGDVVGLSALHGWVKRRKLKSDFCESCKVAKTEDLANISQEYKRDINDFEWLCRKCHMLKDRRINKLAEESRKRFRGHRINFNCLICNKKSTTTLGEIHKGGGKYCSRECYYVNPNLINNILNGKTATA